MQLKQIRGRFADKMLEFDAFQENYRFRLPQGKVAFQTCKGCFCTVFLAVALGLYGFLQAFKLITFDETDVMVISRDKYFDDEFIYKKNLWFAFGITAYDSNRESIEDPSYGVLHPAYKEWGLGGSGAGFSQVRSRECTTRELHILGETEEES